MRGGVRAGFRTGGGRAIARTLLGIVAAATLLVVSAAPGARAAPKFSSIVIDGHTGRVIQANRARELRYPASLTKMMTLYMLFDELKAKRISLNTKLVVSARAAAQQPSRLGLKPGNRITVKNAILALITKSANDVAVVVAESIAGSESAFARRMTRRARAIGMKRTTFRNASGLPNRAQVTTAYDMAQLARALASRFPEYYGYFKTRTFRYRGKVYYNYNRLLGRVAGVDGIKTGYTRASGYNLTTSVKRNGRYLIAVVIGGRSGRARNRTMKALLSRNFAKAVVRRSKPAASKVAATGKPRKMQDRIAPDPTKPSVIATVVTGRSQSRVTTLPAPLTPPAARPRVAALKPTVLIAPASARTPQPDPTEVPLASKPDAPRIEPGKPQVTATDEQRYDSWAIQIGAFASEDAARQRLALAKSKRVQAIKGKRELAVSADVSGKTYFRARFAGFASRNRAERACRGLRRKAIRCYAIAPN